MKINVSEQVYRWILLRWMESIVRISSDKWDNVKVGSIIEVKSCGGEPDLKVKVISVTQSTGIQSLVTCRNYLKVFPNSPSVGSAQFNIAQSLKVSLHDLGNMYTLIEVVLLT